MPLMRCEELASRMSPAADSELRPDAATESATESATEAADLDEHLRACPACRERWRAFQQAESVLMAAPLVAPPDGFRERVLAAVSQERGRALARQFEPRRSPRVAIAAAGFALASVATGLMVVVLGAGLAWNADTLVALAAQSLVMALVHLSTTVASADAIFRAASVMWGVLPATSGEAILSALGLVAILIVFCWAWLVGRYGWGVRPAKA
jgi:predicted anti-sigma-YlaC factor YlaD